MLALPLSPLKQEGVPPRKEPHPEERPLGRVSKDEVVTLLTVRGASRAEIDPKATLILHYRSADLGPRRK
jgi:hypothetical protein